MCSVILVVDDRLTMNWTWWWLLAILWSSTFQPVMITSHCWLTTPAQLNPHNQRNNLIISSIPSYFISYTLYFISNLYFPLKWECVMNILWWLQYRNVGLICVIINDVPGSVRQFSTCVGCGGQIHDQFILRVAPNLEWHAACLKCNECQMFLDENCTCFVRDGKTYCKKDYLR